MGLCPAQCSIKHIIKYSIYSFRQMAVITAIHMLKSASKTANPLMQWQNVFHLHCEWNASKWSPNDGATDDGDDRGKKKKRKKRRRTAQSKKKEKTDTTVWSQMNVERKSAHLDRILSSTGRNHVLIVMKLRFSILKWMCFSKISQAHGILVDDMHTASINVCFFPVDRTEDTDIFNPKEKKRRRK